MTLFTGGAVDTGRPTEADTLSEMTGVVHILLGSIPLDDIIIMIGRDQDQDLGAGSDMADTRNTCKDLDGRHHQLAQVAYEWDRNKFSKLQRT